MARTIDSAKRVINGTFGEVWLDGEKVAECTACQLRVGKNKQTINLCGQFMDDSKATNGSGTGSLTLYKVDSGLIEKQADLQDGWTGGLPLFPNCGTRTAGEPSGWRSITCPLTTLLLPTGRRPRWER